MTCNARYTITLDGTAGERGRFGICVADVFCPINQGGSSCDIFGIVSPGLGNIKYPTGELRGDQDCMSGDIDYARTKYLF
jgi:hypothetical protein